MKEFEKITEKEIKTAGVQALHDRPNAYSRYGSGGMTAQELKEAFDKLAMLIAGRYNEIQRALADGSFAQYVGMPSDLITRLGVSLEDFLRAFKTGTISEKMMVNSVVGTKSLIETIRALYWLDVNDIQLTKDTDGGVRISLWSRSGEMDSVKLVVEKANLAKSVTDFIAKSIEDYGLGTVVPFVKGATGEAILHAETLDEATNKRVDAVEKDTVKSVTYDPHTGVLTFHPLVGDAKHIDLPLELTVESGYYDADANELVIVLTSGDECRIPVDDLIREVISMPTAAAKDAGKVAVVTGENKYELKIPACEFATEGLTYQYADGSYLVVACEQSVGGKIVIPTQIGEIPVREIKSIEQNANVTEIVVPDSVVSISAYAFMKNTGLEKVILSKKLSSISLGLFYLCSNLKDVYIRYDEGVASLAGTVAFGGCTATIHVPKQFLDAYKGATNWAEIADKIVGYETLESLRAQIDTINETLNGFINVAEVGA